MFNYDFFFFLQHQRKTTTDWQCVARNKTINCTAVVKQNGDSFVPGKVYIYTATPGTLQAVKIKAQIFYYIYSVLHIHSGYT